MLIEIAAEITTGQSMIWTPRGNHLIAGEWLGSGATFFSEPAHGPAHAYSVGTVDLVNRACEAAEQAFWSIADTTRDERAAFLDRIADEIEARAEAITTIACQETGLSVARLQGERSRTTRQLRLFASHIRAGSHLDWRHDPALPDRTPLPRPDIRLLQRPVGPVAVFGASNFPLAFSTAGGDTASALAAGCPVVVKGHSAHPGTSEVVAEAIDAARRAHELHPGVFSLIQGGKRDVGTALVRHPRIKAVGFTGSLAGGRALFDLCAARDEPIPFFGELGSVNPMFLLPAAMEARGEAIAKGWAVSLTQDAGQYCTNPGIAVVRADQAQALAEATVAALQGIGAQIMLTKAMATSFRHGRDRVAAAPGIRPLLAHACDGREATPHLFLIRGADWLQNEALAEEVFGPLALIVTAKDADEMTQIARSLTGQLTATLHLDDDDIPEAQALLKILEHKAGRILANGYPTGVEVCDAMVHAGPYPASTNFGATAVGTLAIRRFLRAVSYQNFPRTLLPPDAQP